MELETINKLYLELSQIATAKTARELTMDNQYSDSRFRHIIIILTNEGHDHLAIYLLRLVLNCGLAPAKEYIQKLKEQERISPIFPIAPIE